MCYVQSGEHRLSVDWRVCAMCKMGGVLCVKWGYVLCVKWVMCAKCKLGDICYV